MSTATLAPKRIGDVYEWLSNVELAAVFDGGSARVVISDSYGHEYDGWVDAEGVWCCDEAGPGYLSCLRGWKIDRHY